MKIAHLPVVDSFVTVVVPNMRSTSVAVDVVSARVLVTRAISGIAVGSQATFDYRNAYGHFRFTAVCRDTNKSSATFTLPEDIRTIELFAQADFALEALIDIQWRYAPGGVGRGDFLGDKLMSLSPSTASFILPRDLRLGTLFEMRIRVGDSQTVERIARLVTTEQTDARCGLFGKIIKKVRGRIEFLGTSSADDRVIADFINARQGQRRSRYA